jgi:hypothetical protein
MVNKKLGETDGKLRLDSEDGGDIFLPYVRLPLLFNLILNCEAIGTAATPGLLCQPRVIVKMIVEK